MSSIIDNASSITYTRKVSIVQSLSHSGVRQAQRRGPLLYSFDVDIVPMYFGSTKYYAIEDEIMDSNYSADTISTTITSGTLMDHRGVWDGTPVIDGASESGNQIDISTGSMATTNYGKKGDFVQFDNFSKVYQLTQNVHTDGAGKVTLHLNGAVPSTSSPVNGSAVVFGNSVIFKLALMERPEPKHAGNGIVYYSGAQFQEVIEAN